MANGIVVLAGQPPGEHLVLDNLVAEFGWSLQRVRSLSREGLGQLRKMAADGKVVAVLFSSHGIEIPWEAELNVILDFAPAALPILCHRFSEAVDWPRAAKAGVFHSLLLPFHSGEVRRSLGFVWEAASRVPAPANPTKVCVDDAFVDHDWEPAGVI